MQCTNLTVIVKKSKIISKLMKNVPTSKSVVKVRITIQLKQRQITYNQVHF